jgi:hypothetical protein
MFAMFALVFVPAGMIMRIWRDPLRLRAHDGGLDLLDRAQSGENP